MSLLNVPRADDEVEELPCEELPDVGKNATRGGRMSHGTPSGLEGRLQVDSLTDDEDDDFVTRPASPPGDTLGEDAVEAFGLDPDFDYDNVKNLTRRFG